MVIGRFTNSSTLVSETERNMRTLFIFAVARVVPLRGSAPDKVAVLVVTKDLWSIRLDSEYNLIGTLLQYLRIRPTARIISPEGAPWTAHARSSFLSC